MSEPELRRLSVSDAEAYRRVRLSTLATEPDYFGASLEEESQLPLAHFADRLTSSTVFGACTPTEIVGVIHFRRAPRVKEAHKGSVQGFFVEPEWRQRGLGSALMTQLIGIAREQVEQLTLTVMQGNDGAIALYERFGFVTYGVEPRARRTPCGYLDQILMALLFESR